MKMSAFCITPPMQQSFLFYLFVVILLLHNVRGRQEENINGNDIAQSLLLQRIVAASKDKEPLHGDLIKYPEIGSNFLSKWPLVGEVMPVSSELTDEDHNRRFYLISKTKVKLKTPSTKKNLRFTNKEYMSPCHFKICNMGRKRNVHLHNYY